MGFYVENILFGWAMTLYKSIISFWLLPFHTDIAI